MCCRVCAKILCALYVSGVKIAPDASVLTLPTLITATAAAAAAAAAYDEHAHGKSRRGARHQHRRVTATDGNTCVFVYFAALCAHTIAFNRNDLHYHVHHCCKLELG
jgi:hypothetical protein